VPPTPSRIEQGDVGYILSGLSGYIQGIATRALTMEVSMIVLGIVLLLLGFLTGVPILWTLGVILLVVGLVFELLGSTGRAVGGRRHYY
jgi:hypothetical protein